MALSQEPPGSSRRSRTSGRPARRGRPRRGRAVDRSLGGVDAREATEQPPKQARSTRLDRAEGRPSTQDRCSHEPTRWPTSSPTRHGPERTVGPASPNPSCSREDEGTPSRTRPRRRSRAEAPARTTGPASSTPSCLRRARRATNRADPPPNLCPAASRPENPGRSSRSNGTATTSRTRTLRRATESGPPPSFRARRNASNRRGEGPRSEPGPAREARRRLPDRGHRPASATKPPARRPPPSSGERAELLEVPKEHRRGQVVSLQCHADRADSHRQVDPPTASKCRCQTLTTR